MLGKYASGNLPNREIRQRLQATAPRKGKGSLAVPEDLIANFYILADY
jgi:hypothetical protein